MNRSIISALLILAESPGFAAAPDPSLFEIDLRLRVELFAAEPDVVDPVALTFDEAGRMYVVEMRDYPYGIGPERKPGGVIRLLEDTDGDGKADKSTVFAKDLSFPTSIVPWDGGVFVTAPPDIIYLKDTNGDGVADIREVYFTGFIPGVTDSNVNGLRWGLDNRIHGVNGGNGGTVRAVKYGQPVVLVDGSDFSFDPRNGEFRTTYQTSGGFGLVFDEFGRSFVTYNINHIQERIMPLSAMNRLPGMLTVEATQSISDHGDMARIFPVSVAQTRPNHPEQAGFFFIGGGLGYIGYDVYPGDLNGSITVGDVVGNLLHRDVLETNGPIFMAHRSKSEINREFLASRDSACRLTGLELGPDGALYVIDMQRDVIEHPDYIPKKILDKINIRAGEDRGRIYRITPKEGLPKTQRSLANASFDQLAVELESHNQWRRMTAQRLLVEKHGTPVAAKLSTLVERSDYQPARVNALWTLEGMHRLPETTLRLLLRSTNEAVLENVFRIIEARQSDFPETLTLLSTSVSSPSPRVRFQLAMTLGKFEEPRAQNSIARLLLSDRASYWNRMAALSSLRNPLTVLSKAFEIIAASSNTVPSDLDLLRELSELSVLRSDHPAAALVEAIQVLENRANNVTLAALEGLDQGVARKGVSQARLGLQPDLTRIGKKSDDLFFATWKLSRRLNLPETLEQKLALQQAIELSRAPGTSRPNRLHALRLLAFGRYQTIREALFTNLNALADSEVQTEALKTLSAFRQTEIAERLVQQWPTLSPSLRNSALNLLLSRKPFHNALVTAIEKGDLKPGELNLDLEQRRTLLRESTPDIQARAAKFIGDEEYSNRKTIVNDWLPKLPASGDPAKGKPVFETICAQCHRIGTIGHSVGPDLTSIAHRSVEDIASNILDPNMAINPKYVTWQIETKDGDLVTGIVDKESSDSITLLQANEIRSAVPRKSIAGMKSTGISLMPEGLEAGMTPVQLRDLIAFLQNSL